MTFDVNEFRSIYPQFANFTDAQLQYFWDNACLISGLADSPSLPADKRKTLLYLFTCHLATIAQRQSVGGIGSATEGSVALSFVQPPSAGEEAWWYNQTPCGAAYWRAIKSMAFGGSWFNGR